MMTATHRRWSAFIAAPPVRGYQLESDPVIELAGIQADDSSSGFHDLTS
jgi:hypothetical protein